MIVVMGWFSKHHSASEQRLGQLLTDLKAFCPHIKHDTQCDFITQVEQIYHGDRSVFRFFQFHQCAQKMLARIAEPELSIHDPLAIGITYEIVREVAIMSDDIRPEKGLDTLIRDTQKELKEAALDAQHPGNIFSAFYTIAVAVKHKKLPNKHWQAVSQHLHQLLTTTYGENDVEQSFAAIAQAVEVDDDTDDGSAVEVKRERRLLKQKLMAVLPLLTMVRRAPKNLAQKWFALKARLAPKNHAPAFA